MPNIAGRSYQVIASTGLIEEGMNMVDLSTKAALGRILQEVKTVVTIPPGRLLARRVMMKMSGRITMKKSGYYLLNNWL